MFAPIRRFLVLLLTLPALVAACAPAKDSGPVVLAASSLQDAMEDLADGWEAQGHARPVLSFAASSALARQVEGGAPADLIVSADREWMDWLAERGLIRPGTRADIAANGLALIAPAGAVPLAGELDRAGLLARLGDGRLAVGETRTVPAGRYARASLEALGLWPAVADRLAPAENVRAALALVERGEAPLGIVYTTDARASGRVGVVTVLPDASHPPIRYPAALLAGSDHPDAAGFLRYIGGAEGAAVLARHGFGPAR